jgi:hypothetical protein
MAVKLNNGAYDHAKELINAGHAVRDRCGVLAAESRAGQYNHDDIKAAAAHLHGMLDA